MLHIGLVTRSSLVQHIIISEKNFQSGNTNNRAVIDYLPNYSTQFSCARIFGIKFLHNSGKEHLHKIILAQKKKRR